MYTKRIARQGWGIMYATLFAGGTVRGQLVLHGGAGRRSVGESEHERASERAERKECGRADGARPSGSTRGKADGHSGSQGGERTRPGRGEGGRLVVVVDRGARRDRWCAARPRWGRKVAMHRSKWGRACSLRRRMVPRRSETGRTREIERQRVNREEDRRGAGAAGWSRGRFHGATHDTRQSGTRRDGARTRMGAGRYRC